MAPIALLVAALVAPLAFAVPTPGNTYGTGGSAPSGWDASVENFCMQDTALNCCKTIIAGAAGQPDASYTGCIPAMAGGQITYLFGYCPYNYSPVCCLVVGPAGVDTGCGLPTQVYEPNH